MTPRFHAFFPVLLFVSATTALAAGCARLEAMKASAASQSSSDATKAKITGKKFTDQEFSCYETKAALALAAATPITYVKDVEPLLAARCTSCHSTAGGSPPDLSTYAGASAAAQSSLDQVKGGLMPKSGALSAAEQEVFSQWLEGGVPEGDGAPPPAGDLKAMCHPARGEVASTGPEPADTGSGSGESGSGSGTGSGSTSTDSGSGSGSGSDDGSGTGSGSGAASGSGSDVTRIFTYNADAKAALTAKCVGCHAAGQQAPALDTFAAAKAAGAASAADIASGKMPPANATALTSGFVEAAP